MTDAELAVLDATALADLVRRKEVTPLELVDASIGRIERLDDGLGAVIHRHFERARSEAKGPLPDGPFTGVPFLLKDLAAGNRAGDPHHWGTRFLRDAGYVAPTTSHLLERFDAAGLVTVGRTNVPELGAWTTTEPEAYGPTRNPWNPEHSCGGSSGGAAAAVASGMVPFAHASDGGGSIRNPASQSGLIGLKPTRGRLSLGPDVGDAWASQCRGKSADRPEARDHPHPHHWGSSCRRCHGSGYFRPLANPPTGRRHRPSHPIHRHRQHRHRLRHHVWEEGERTSVWT